MLVAQMSSSAGSLLSPLSHARKFRHFPKHDGRDAPSLRRQQVSREGINQDVRIQVYLLLPASHSNPVENTSPWIRILPFRAPIRWAQPDSMGMTLATGLPCLVITIPAASKWSIGNKHCSLNLDGFMVTMLSIPANVHFFCPVDIPGHRPLRSIMLSCTAARLPHSSFSPRPPCARNPRT